MPKTTYNMMTREWGLRHHEVYEAIWHTRAFRRFCERTLDRVKQEVADRRSALSQKPAEDREAHEAAWIDLPFDEAVDMALRSAFLETNEAQIIQDRLDLMGLGMHRGAIAVNPKLIPGPQAGEQYISLLVDLAFPKEHLRTEFEHILDEWRPRVQQPPAPPRGTAIMEMTDINLMYRAYDLVEEHLAQGDTRHESVLKATLQFYTRTRRPRLKEPPVNDKRYQQVKRLHDRVKSIIGDL
ncbi:MAG: hypothetical protein ACLPT6_05120 [Desulfobaccales bacterium]